MPNELIFVYKNILNIDNQFIIHAKNVLLK